jgi:tetratricopeptide (TPR) repeat protein
MSCLRRICFYFPLASFLFLCACNRGTDYYLSRGDRLLRDGKFKDASIEYKKAIQKDANSGQAYFQLSEALIQQGDTPGGYRALSMAAKLLPANQEVKVKLADLSLAAYIANPASGRALYDKTRELEKQLLSRDSKSFDGLRLAGALALLDQKPKDAIAYFSRAAEINPNDPKAILGLSQGLFQDNQAAEGEKLVLQLIQRQAYGPAIDFLYGHYNQQHRWSDSENLLKLKLSRNPKDPSTIFDLARLYSGLQRPVDAAEILQRLLDNPKDFPDARLQIGDFYASVGNAVDALRFFDEGVKVDGSRKLIYEKRRIGVLLALGRRDDALQSLEEILKGSPKDEDALQLRAGVLLDGGKPENVDQAIRDLEAVVSKRPDNAQLRFRLGQAYRHKGDVGAARKHLEAVKTRDAGTMTAVRLELAEIAFAQGRPEDALRFADQALSIISANPKARLYRSVALTALGRHDEARAGLSGLLRDNPRYAEARLQQAILAITEKKFVEAQEILSKLQEANPNDARPLMGLAESYAVQAQFDKALIMLTGELKKSPNRVDLRLLLGTMAVRAGKLDLAIDQYRALVAQDSKSAEWLMRLGNVYQLKGDSANAAKQFEQAKQLAPSAVAPVVFLAESLERSGHVEEAKANYRRALQLQPDNPIIMNNLAQLLADSGGSLDEALDLSRRALQKAPDQAPIIDTLGWVYLKKNSIDSALQTFTSLSRKYPDVPVFRYHLGLAAMQKGDRLMAKNEIEKALASKPSPQEAVEMRDVLAKLGK